MEQLYRVFERGPKLNLVRLSVFLQSTQKLPMTVYEIFSLLDIFRLCRDQEFTEALQGIFKRFFRIEPSRLRKQFKLLIKPFGKVETRLGEVDLPFRGPLLLKLESYDLSLFYHMVVHSGKLNTAIPDPSYHAGVRIVRYDRPHQIIEFFSCVRGLFCSIKRKKERMGGMIPLYPSRAFCCSLISCSDRPLIPFESIESLSAYPCFNWLFH